MIVALSDVHLGFSCCEERIFRRFLQDILLNPQIDHVVLMGDIFDMWRRDPVKLLIEYSDILELLREMRESKSVHYVVGNHDYHMIEAGENLERKYNVEVGTETLIPYGDQSYYFVHGHQFEFPDSLDSYQQFAGILCMGDDATGRTADGLWNLYKTCFGHFDTTGTESRLKQKFKTAVGLPAERLQEKAMNNIQKEAVKKREEFEDQIGDCFIVYGHTHHSYVDPEQKMANTGSWVDDTSVPHLIKDTYITIDERGAVNLLAYPP
ncbi:MAG: UDP-2,3-diacylglucosamine diphosphatase [Theionarchaea archaeon]|nr:UDP-2,3-diacylglucosamine diphosphatase [Theionarchaea archaeon]MBU7036362.1 UDP-2,3-diacylglucosamine diphosphatase [Theionarchaea archaeon]